MNAERVEFDKLFVPEQSCQMWNHTCGASYLMSIVGYMRQPTRTLASHSARRCAIAISVRHADAFFEAATTRLQHPAAPVQVGAVRAVSALAAEFGADYLSGYVPRLYQGQPGTVSQHVSTHAADSAPPAMGMEDDRRML